MLDEQGRRAIAGLVASGRLTQAQADDVVASLTQPAAPRGRADRPGRWSERLVETAAYAGSLLVGVALAFLVAQNAHRLSHAGQLGLLAGLAVLTAAVAVGVVRATTGGRAGALASPARRRLISVLTVATAACTTAFVIHLVSPSDIRLWFTLLGLATVVAAYLFAPSMLAEIVMFGLSVSLLLVLRGVLANHFAPVFTGPFGSRPPVYWLDRVYPLVEIALGLLWALVLPRRIWAPDVARVLGVGLVLVISFAVILDDRTSGEGVVLLAVLAAFSLWQYMRSAHWQWLPSSIAALAGFMYHVVGGATSPIVGFLVAGLVLLALSGLAVRRRRHAAIPTASDPT